MRGAGGFTLVELLVTLAVFGLLYAGVHSLFTSTFTAWRQGRERFPLYQVGLGLVDSITRDARAAKNMTGTTFTLDPVTKQGLNLILVFNYPARWNGTSWDVKRVTYRNTAEGFMRLVESGQTDNPALFPPEGQHQDQVWVLSRQVADFRFERADLFGGNPRVVRFFLYLHREGPGAGPAQYVVNGRAWIRRTQDVPQTVGY